MIFHTFHKFNYGKTRVEFSHKLNLWKVWEILKVIMMIFQQEDKL